MDRPSSSHCYLPSPGSLASESQEHCNSSPFLLSPHSWTFTLFSPCPRLLIRKQSRRKCACFLQWTYGCQSSLALRGLCFSTFCDWHTDSTIREKYIFWPTNQVKMWALHFHRTCHHTGTSDYSVELGKSNECSLHSSRATEGTSPRLGMSYLYSSHKLELRKWQYADIVGQWMGARLSCLEENNSVCWSWWRIHQEQTWEEIFNLNVHLAKGKVGGSQIQRLGKLGRAFGVAPIRAAGDKGQKEN